MNDIPAFPHAIYSGMTLRDYFAAKAMQSLAPQALKQDWSLVETAARSYAVADAMMKAREA